MGSYIWRAGEQGSGNGSGMAQVGAMRTGGSYRNVLAFRIVGVIVGLVMIVDGLGDLVGAMSRSEPSKRTLEPMQVQLSFERESRKGRLLGDQEDALVGGSSSDGKAWSRIARLGQLPGTALRPKAAGNAPTEHASFEALGVVMEAEVPEGWTDWLADVWLVDGRVVGPQLVLCPDCEAYENAAAPGMTFMASRELAKEVEHPADYLDSIATNIGAAYWTYAGRMDYDDGMYTGALDVWTDGKENGRVLVAIAAEPPDGSMLMLVLVHLASAADEQALWTIIGSFTAR